MNNKILVALSNYDIPNSLMNYSLQLGKSMNMPCTLLSVVNVPVTADPVSIVGEGIPQPRMTLMSEVQDEAIRKLEKMVIVGKEHWRYLDYEVNIGFPESKLITKAEEEQPFLVVLERNSDETLFNNWFGTYETRLAEEISVPTLVVPNGSSPDRVLSILYVLDSEAYSEGDIMTLAEVVRRTGAQLDVAIKYRDVTLDNDMKDIVQRIESFIPKDKVEYHKIGHNDVEESVDMLRQKLRSTWLCINFKEQGVWESLFNSRDSEKLLLETDIPVLVV